MAVCRLSLGVCLGSPPHPRFSIRATLETVVFIESDRTLGRHQISLPTRWHVPIEPPDEFVHDPPTQGPTLEFWNDGHVLHIEAHRTVSHDAPEPHEAIAPTQTYDVEAVGEGTFRDFGRDLCPAHGDP
jgi:hypothetical protein